jgi:multidrug efflux pump subunit AcrB
MNALVRAAVGRPVSTVMVFLAFVIVGTFAAFSLGVSDLPEVRVPKLVVSTSYPGLPAQEVRTLVTLPLEDALASARGLKHVESISREGVSTITLEFHWGTDLRVAGVEVREALDAARSLLPADAKKPLVLPVDPADEPLAVVAVTPRSGDLALAKRLASKEIRTRLQQVRGVGAVVTVGGLDEEILVDVDRTRLQARSLTLSELAQVLAAANYDYPAGTLVEGPDELVVKAQGRVSSPGALGDLWVTPGGNSQYSPAPFPVADVARIEWATADPSSAFSVSGASGVGLYIHKQPGAGPVETVDAVRREVSQLETDYGRDLDVRLEFDGTGSVRQSLSSLVFDALAGVLVAFVVVFLFVRDPATSFIIVISVPVAVILTLGSLKLFGRTLNMFSIGGLALSIGMMVDHTVVVLENLHRRVGAGPKSIMAVTQATTELSLSNVGATGTAVIVFLPIIFLQGVVGTVFSDLSLAVMGAHLASFLLSVTLVPALFLILPTRHRDSDRMMLPLKKIYRRTLGTSLRRPWLVGVCLVLITGLGVGVSPLLKYEFFPVFDEGVVDVVVSLPLGTSIPTADALARELEGRLGAIPGVSGTYARIGGDEDDAYFHADPNERKERLNARVLVQPGRSATEVASAIRSTVSIGQEPPGVSLPRSPIVRLLGVDHEGRSLLVTGRHPREVRDHLDDLRSSLASEAMGLRVFPEGSRPEIHFSPDRPMVAQTGTDLTAVAGALRDGIDGVVATKVTVAGRDVDVRIRMQATDREDLPKVKAFPVKGRDGTLISVGELGTLTQVDAEAAFYRYDRTDALVVQQGARGPAWSVAEHREDVRVPSAEVARDQSLSFVLTFALVLILLYLFLGAQLESFVLPLGVMLAIPLSFSGIILALVLGGVSVNASSLLGVVALFGVVINNSILLYQVYRDRAPGPWPLVVVGGSLTRLRPILMTVSITVLSLGPLVLDPHGSAEGGMALALVGGLVVSTALTLFVVPLVFLPLYHKAGPR